jgi:hypothetical protein
VDSTNSQKSSTRISEKNDEGNFFMDHERPHRTSSTGREARPHLDSSDDLAARVRAAKEAAERELEAFGDVSEYEIRKIYGQRTDINYDEKKQPAAAHIKPEPCKTIPKESSRKDTRKNVDRQTSLEFSVVPPQCQEH